MHVGDGVPIRFPKCCNIPCALRWPESRESANLDIRQITHLICVHLRHLLYDIFRGCFGAFYIWKTTGRRPKTPPKSQIVKVLGGHRLDE